MTELNQGLLEYHQRSKHRVDHYAPGPAGLDWANQPDPFRAFPGAARHKLALAADSLATRYNELRQGELGFQQIQFAGRIGGGLHAVELLGLLGQANGFIAGALAGGGGKRLSVIGDEVFLDPGRAAGLDAEIVQLHFGVVEKFFGVGGGGLGLSAAGQG